MSGVNQKPDVVIRYLIGVVLLGVCNLVQAEEFNAKVIAVMDGDTVLILRDGRKIKVRLVNIDAPESDQEFGKESRQALVNLVLKKQVRVKSQAIDSYGRMIAEISVDGVSVNALQVSSGMAWEYSRYHHNKHYLSLAKQAQQARRGLWAKGNRPISPEQWRRTHASSKHTINAVCGTKNLCRQMLSCEEARRYLQLCGINSLDGDGDGIPCEGLCATE